jgi:hypothetical protein
VLERELGNFNPDGYCKFLGYQGARWQRHDVYGWYCFRGAEHRSFDPTSGCRWQYHRNDAYARYRDYNDPSSWHCLSP